MSVPLHNTIILLIGFAGTGKYTIGRELVRLSGAKLIDNHLINNPVFTAINADGVTPLPAGVWDQVSSIRQIVYNSIRELSPPDLSFIFTMQLIESNPDDYQGFRSLEELANERRSLFMPVRLICEVEELCRRVANPARKERLKEITPETTRRRSANHTVLQPQHPNLRTIDVTSITAVQCANLILQEVDSLRSRL